MTDVRDPDPNATAHRRARFQVGWQNAVEGQQYGADTLSRLTWQNLGWRLGERLGPTPVELIQAMYDWCVDQQAKSGTAPADG